MKSFSRNTAPEEYSRNELAHPFCSGDLRGKETGKTMTEDEMGAFFWTLGLQFDDLEPHEMEEE